jgi:hypothetical protein
VLYRAEKAKRASQLSQTDAFEEARRAYHELLTADRPAGTGGRPAGRPPGKRGPKPVEEDVVEELGVDEG